MNEDLHNIDKLFKQALDQHNEEPSSEVWENIDKNLDKKNVVSISRKYNKLKWIAAALLLFSFGMAMYTLQMRRKDKEIVRKNNTEKHAPKNIEEADGHKNNNVEDRNNDPAIKVDTTKDKKITGDNPLINQEKDVTGDLEHKNDPNPAGNLQSISGRSIKKQFYNVSDKTLRQRSIKKNTAIKSSETGKEIISEQDKISKLSVIGDDAISKNTSSDKLKNNLKEKTKKDKAGDINEDQKLAGNVSPEKDQTNIAENSPLKEARTSLPDIAGSEKKETEISNKTIALQNPKKVGGKSSKLRSGRSFTGTVFFSPDFVSADVENDHPRFREDDRDEIKKNERPTASSSFGFLIDYTWNKKWSLQSGVTVSSQVSEIHNKTVYARPDNHGNINYRVSCSTGPAYIPSKPGNSPASGDSAKALSGKNTLQYIGIPLVLKYNLTKGKFGISPGVGISANILSKGKIETILSTTAGMENSTNKIEELRSIYFNGLIGIAAEYNLNKKIGLNFTPTARFALSSINQDGPVKTKLNSVGLVAGISFRF